jgi:uncharacterized NAD-dependent epimerase/dehydratase family protein
MNSDISSLPTFDTGKVVQLRSTRVITPFLAADRPHAVPDEKTAIIYCEGNFGTLDGKTANGLVRHSETYKVLSVIDSQMKGRDTGEILDGTPNGIPVHGTLEDAFREADRIPNTLIIGMAPSDGMLSPDDRDVIFEAIALGMNIVSGLHEFLGEDEAIVVSAKANRVCVTDVRKPKRRNDLRLYDGRIDTVTCPRIAVLGTDCAIGKRTTATLLTKALRAHGVNAVMIGTGQTGILQGERYGVPLDSVPSQFCAGELEGVIVDAFETEEPDLIMVEGQGALSHPAFCTSAFILRGSKPNAVILQHSPARPFRCDFPDMTMPTPASEIALIEGFAETKVIGLTLNHEGMSGDDISTAIEQFERELKIPVAAPLMQPIEKSLEIVAQTFPEVVASPFRQPINVS